MINKERCRLRYKRLRRKGLCIQCGKRKSSFAYCAVCRFTLPKRYQSMAATAKKKNLEVMTFDEFKKKIDNAVCIYGRQLIEKTHGAGLDRIDSIKGYTFSNTVPCCGRHNAIKGSYLTFSDMSLLIKKGSRGLKRCAVKQEIRSKTGTMVGLRTLSK